MASDELIQVVDENDKPLRGDTRQHIWEQGALHRIVYIMVESPEGEILLQKRGSNMDTFPDCWDVSAAGHVDAGEEYDIAARRELEEELGLTGFELSELGKYQSSDTFEWRKLNRFNVAYRVVVPRNTKFALQEAEVGSTKWFSTEEVKQLINEHPDTVANGLKNVFSHFYR